MTAILIAAAVVLVGLGLFFALRGRRPTSVGRPVRYTVHARERMHQRGVTVAEIESVLAAPQRVLRDVEENSVRLERGLRDDALLKVWVVAPWPGEGEIVVKSTAWSYVVEFSIPRRTIGRVVGRGGSTIENIRRMTGAQVSVERTGAVRVTGDSPAEVKAAKRRVLEAARG